MQVEFRSNYRKNIPIFAKSFAFIFYRKCLMILSFSSTSVVSFKRIMNQPSQYLMIITKFKPKPKEI